MLMKDVLLSGVVADGKWLALCERKKTRNMWDKKC